MGGEEKGGNLSTRRKQVSHSESDPKRDLNPEPLPADGKGLF